MKTHQNATYDLKYHIILVTKNKEELINEEIGGFLTENITRLINQKGEVIKTAFNKNHFFLLAEVQPQYAISVVINSLKSATSRLIKKNFSIESPFWDNNYFVSSVGEFSIEKAKKYIESRGKND